MRGRTNIPPRLGGIVNGVVREYKVQQEGGIETGDYVQFVGPTSDEFNITYYGSEVELSEKNASITPFGVYKLPDGNGIYFGRKFDTGAIFYGILTVDESGSVSGVSVQEILTHTYYDTVLSVCEIKEGVFLVSAFIGQSGGGEQETLILTYKNGAVSFIRNIQSPYSSSWSLLLGAAVINISGNTATMVALAGNMSFSSSGTNTPIEIYGLVTFSINFETGAFEELNKVTDTGLSLSSEITLEGFWNSGTYALSIDSLNSSNLCSWSVSSSGSISGSVVNHGQIARGDRFSKISNGVYCRIFVPLAASGLIFYSSTGKAWVNQSGKTYGGVQVQIMRISSGGVSISNGGDIQLTVPDSIFTPPTGTVTYSFCLGGGACSYIGGNKIMVVIPIVFCYGTTPYNNTYAGGITVAVSVGIIEYDPSTDIFSGSNQFTEGYSYDFTGSTLSFVSNMEYFYGKTLPGFVINNKCNFVAFYAGRYSDNALPSKIYPDTTSIQGISFTFEGGEILKPSDSILVKKYVSKIAGVAKTSGKNGDFIEVYAPE